MKHKDFRLQSWEEIVGVLHNFDSNGNLCLKIGSYSLSFEKGSEEESCILQQIKPAFIGREIAILKTDLLKKPILIRKTCKSEENEKLDF